MQYCLFIGDKSYKVVPKVTYMLRKAEAVLK